MDSSEIIGNAARAGAVTWSASGHITNCLFEQNGGFSDEEVTSHLQCDEPSATITRCIFRQNIPGTISVFLSSGGTFLLPAFLGNVVEDNVTTIVTGTIALFAGGGELSYNLVRNNTNIRGGAVYVTDGSTVRIHHNWFEGNATTDSSTSSAVATFGNTHPVLDSNVFVHNHGQAVGWFVLPPDHPSIFAQYNWWGSDTGPYHPMLNPAGQGDTLLQDSIHFIPWLTAPPDTSMPNAVRERPSMRPPTTWRLMTLWPNPFNGEIQMAFAGFADEDFEINLYNIIGQNMDRIHQGPLTGGTLIYHAPPTLSSGVYFVRAASRNWAEHRKVVLLK